MHISIGTVGSPDVDVIDGPTAMNALFDENGQPRNRASQAMFFCIDTLKFGIPAVPVCVLAHGASESADEYQKQVEHCHSMMDKCGLRYSHHGADGATCVEALFQRRCMRTINKEGKASKLPKAYIACSFSDGNLIYAELIKNASNPFKFS